MLQLKPKSQLVRKSDSELRHARLERAEDVVLESAEDAHSWAVSYSDLLMVLMSFFVIFFSFGESEKKKVLTEISGSLKGASERSPDGSLASTSPQSAAMSRGARGELQSNLEKLGRVVQVDEGKGSLTILLSPNLYIARGFRVREPLQAELEAVLNLLKPHIGQIKIRFIGHSDSSVVTKRPDDIVSSNFMLSSLRATFALEYALSQGFPGERLFAEGAANNTGNSRSLSIRVEQD